MYGLYNDLLRVSLQGEWREWWVENVHFLDLMCQVVDRSCLAQNTHMFLCEITETRRRLL
jgi:hypothetical protein